MNEQDLDEKIEGLLMTYDSFKAYRCDRGDKEHVDTFINKIKSLCFQVWDKQARRTRRLDDIHNLLGGRGGKEEKNCKFCKEYKKYLQHYYKSGEKYCEIKVSYCPVCGSKL